MHIILQATIALIFGLVLCVCGFWIWSKNSSSLRALGLLGVLFVLIGLATVLASAGMFSEIRKGIAAKSDVRYQEIISKAGPGDLLKPKKGKRWYIVKEIKDPILFVEDFNGDVWIPSIDSTIQFVSRSDSNFSEYYREFTTK
jgi:hypothetical protein